MIKVLVDSASSITPEMARAMGLHLIPLKVAFGEETFLDGVDLDTAGFYKRLAASPSLPVTSQPSAGEFLQLFERLTADGSELLCVLISHGLSGALLSAETARGMLPGGSIQIFDSLSISVGEALLAMAAADMAKAGQPMAAIVARLERLRARMRVFFVLDTLEFVRRGGRVTGLEALLGTMLRIKPILHTIDGRIEPLEKVRTRQRAIERMVELAAAVAGDSPVWCGIGGGDCPDEVAALEQAVRARFDCQRLWSVDSGPTIGTHAGPGVIGLAICPMLD